MNTRTYTIIGSVAIATAVVTGVILSLQNFDASKVDCDDIASTRAELQALYETGVNASIEVFADEKAEIDERLSQCLSAKPIDPCADVQKVRDAAVEAYNSIASPPDNAPYAEFQVYFNRREEAYQNYKKAKDALDQCRAANPPKSDVPYEKSDTKACFNAYDASVEATRETFSRNTNAMRTALKTALSALDAREKACHPPEDEKKFTESIGGDRSGKSDETTLSDLLSCRPINPNLDSELFSLQSRASQIPSEIQAIETGINNIKKRMSPLQQNLRDVDTYIPPESTKTQFEGALNALRAERKVALESSLEYYKNLLSRREKEKEALEQELSDIQSKIAKRLEEIKKENESRQRNFPTNLHLSGPDKCEYYHCHGLICGRQDPAPNGCGHGSTTQSDVDCSQFFDAYLKASGVN